MTDQVNETVFNSSSEQTPATEASTPEVKAETSSPEIENYADLLKEITREDGTQKYANVPDVIKATKASQEHIKTLEAEAITLKAELEKRMAAEEVLEQIKANKTDEVTPSESLDLDQIDALMDSKISDTLTAVESKRIADGNVQAVIEAMTKQHGSMEKAEEHFIATAEASGFTINQMNSLSATNPQAVLKLAGVGNVSQGSPAHTNGSINTAALKPNETSPSLKVPPGATGKDMAAIWRAAGENLN